MPKMAFSRPAVLTIPADFAILDKNPSGYLNFFESRYSILKISLWEDAMIFYTADLHFHYEPFLPSRPFGSVEEMDRVLIARWNAAV